MVRPGGNRTLNWAMSERRSRQKSADAGRQRPVRGSKAPAPGARELVDAICGGISLGRSVRAMCAETGVSQRVLWNWLAGDAGLMRQYQRAKELGVDAYAEEIIEISDDGSRDVSVDEKGREVTNREIIARSQLRIDARKWYAARLAPKKYGDRSSGARWDEGQEKPAVHSVEVAFVAPSGAGEEGMGRGSGVRDSPAGTA